MLLRALIISLSFVMLLISGFTAENHQLHHASFNINCVSDAKGSVREVTIGDQIWMSTNLNCEKFRNGDKIPQAKNFTEWYNCYMEMIPCWCYLDFDPSNEQKYGKLYNIAAVWDKRELAPSGWHIPSASEWEVLINHLGGDSLAVGQLKASEGWICGKDRTPCNGSNSSGFSALPGGSMSGNYFLGKGSEAVWWTSSIDTGNPWQPERTFVVLGRESVHASKTDDISDGFSVRCIKNK